MKNLVNIWMVVVMVMVMGFSFVACDKENEFGDGEEWLAPAKTDPTPDPTPEPKDSIDWSREMERSFGYNRHTGEWPSTITIHYTNGKEDGLYGHNCPMTSNMHGPSVIFVDSTAASSKFEGITFISRDSTQWLPENGKEQELLATSRWEVKMGNFRDTITSTHVSARLVLEGRYVNFMSGNEPAPVRLSETSVMGNDTVVNGKTYTTEIVNVQVTHKIHQSYPITTVAWTTRVLREKTVKEEMPNPDLKVSAYGNVNNITFSPEFVGNNNVIWHKVCLTRNHIDGKEYFSIWVDGVFVRTVELKSNERNDLYNSAYLVDGTWVPAILRYSSSNDGGWDYTFVVSGEAKMKTVDQRMAVTSGLSNFKKDNDASQTPSVYTTTSVKEYGTKKLVTVTGFDKDNRPVISFTIGECL